MDSGRRLAGGCPPTNHRGAERAPPPSFWSGPEEEGDLPRVNVEPDHFKSHL